MATINFNTLPTEVQEKAKEVLKIYNEVHIIFENGEYKASACYGLRSSYPADFKVIGDYKAEEIFTPDERILNYINSFHEYPIEYKGKRNYPWLKTLTWEDTVIFDSDHNLVTA